MARFIPTGFGHHALTTDESYHLAVLSEKLPYCYGSLYPLLEEFKETYSKLPKSEKNGVGQVTAMIGLWLNNNRGFVRMCNQIPPSMSEFKCRIVPTSQTPAVSQPNTQELNDNVKTTEFGASESGLFGAKMSLLGITPPDLFAPLVKINKSLFEYSLDFPSLKPIRVLMRRGGYTKLDISGEISHCKLVDSSDVHSSYVLLFIEFPRKLGMLITQFGTNLYVDDTLIKESQWENTSVNPNELWHDPSIDEALWINHPGDL